MAAPAPTAAAVVPAQLAFLAIYNPSLGATDDTIDDQILYYYSSSPSTPPPSTSPLPPPASASASAPASDAAVSRNKRLRQIGLAQGMVEFGRSFSGGSAVDSVDTERSRVVLRELEAGWWILASIDLARVPGPGGVDFSARELKPPALLARDLQRLHAVFVLHNGGSLARAGGRGRPALAARLRRYWDRALAAWEVSLGAGRGSPARDALGAIAVAASGELGVGVGEEDWGSGEREVLEGFVGRVDGLVDLVVGRYGEAEGAEGWLGNGGEPGVEDGAVFLGVGALERPAVRDVVYWMEDMYTWGRSAYGVTESSVTGAKQRRGKRRIVKASPSPMPSPPPPPLPQQQQQQREQQQQQQQDSTWPTGQRLESSPPEPDFGPPPPLIGPGRATSAKPADVGQADNTSEGASESGGVDRIVSYLKLGYGTYWTLGGSPSTGEGEDAGNARSRSAASRKLRENGHYLIGLVGDVDEDDMASDTETNQPQDGTGAPRIRHRTITVECRDKAPASQDAELAERPPTDRQHGSADDSTPGGGDEASKTDLQAVVYVNRPFIFAFLFRPGTASLSSDHLYRSLHHQLAPLRGPLVQSTSCRPGRPAGAPQQIYDLVWDPRALTVHSTIPGIPDGGPPAAAAGAPWSRVDALNTHAHILALLAATRADPSQLERTAKTSRGWWVVWNRVVQGRVAGEGAAEGGEGPLSDVGEGESAGDGGPDGMVVVKEIFLVRKARDHGPSHFRAVSSSYAPGGGGWADGANRLAQGIGVDTRKYIEGLLSVNR